MMKSCPSCGTHVDDEEVTCPSCGVELQSATESFAPVAAPEKEVPAASLVGGEGPVLVVAKGPDVGERFYLDRAEVTVGRDPESGIFLNDVTVSREHATLRIADDRVTIVDLSSLNGTYVNGLRVDEAELSDGDVVQVGRFQLIFSEGGEPA